MTPVATDVTETGGFTITEEPREANPLLVRPVLGILPRERDLNNPAEAIYARFGRRCWFQQGAGRPDFDAEPIEWVSKHLLEPTVWRYARGLRRLDLQEPEHALKVAHELIEFVASENLTVRTYVLLDTPRAPATLAAGPVAVRPLTAEELGQLNQFRFDEIESLFRWSRPGGNTMLEVVEEHLKTTWRRPTGLVHRIVLAFHLSGIPISGVNMASSREFPIPSGTTGTPLGIARYGPTATIIQSQLEKVIELAARIPEQAVLDPRAPHEIALSRFGSAFGDRTATDALIDLVVALEALLLPRESEGELRFRFGLYGAFATGADSDERPDLFKQFTRIYDTRSKIVHGTRVEFTELREVVETAKGLVGRVLKRGLAHGWLSPDQLRSATLKGGIPS